MRITPRGKRCYNINKVILEGKYVFQKDKSDAYYGTD